MSLKNCRNLVLNGAGSLIKWAIGANLFFALSVILRSLIYLTIGLPFITFFQFQFIVFILSFLSFYVDITPEK